MILIAAFALSVLLVQAPASWAATHTMTIDSTALSSTGFRLDHQSGGSVGTFRDPTAPVTLSLDEGSYLLFPGSGLTLPCLLYVTTRGSWDYDHVCDGFVTGRGTDTVQLLGYPITVNSQLSTAFVFSDLFNPPVIPAGPSSTQLTLLPTSPGTPAVNYRVTPSSGTVAACTFHVNLDGTVSYPAAYEGCLSGAGSNTVTFNGFPVNVDATQLSTTNYNLLNALGMAPNQPSTVVEHYRLLPLSDGTYGPFQAGGDPWPSLGLNVGFDGNVTYPASADGWVSGRGTGTLVIHGYPVAIDATAAAPGTFALFDAYGLPGYGGAPGGLDRAAVQPLRLAPVSYHYVGSPFDFHWSIREADGTITLGGDAPRCVFGTGTSRLTVGCLDCTKVTASPSVLWPPNHQLELVKLAGLGEGVSLTITGVTQDEPLNGLGDGNTTPDATPGPSSDSVYIRAERSGTGDGRVYRIAFTAADGVGRTCSGTTTVAVPHDVNSIAIDSGQNYNSFGS